MICDDWVIVDYVEAVGQGMVSCLIPFSIIYFIDDDDVFFVKELRFHKVIRSVNHVKIIEVVVYGNVLDSIFRDLIV